MYRKKALGTVLAAFMLLTFLLTDAKAAERCENWVARVESVQGTVEAREEGSTGWVPVKLNDIFCEGALIRVGENSRAALSIPDQGILRLDENSAIHFRIRKEEKEGFWVNLLKGAANFFSRTRRGLSVDTPFLNATIEGTEFFIKVTAEESFLSVFEGRVLASNSLGSLLVASGQSVKAESGTPPVRVTVVRPRDAVQWALYYPPVLHYRAKDFWGTSDRETAVRRSIELYWAGDIIGALAALEGQEAHDARFLTWRAGLFLTVGQVEAANRAIQDALEAEPSNAEALALQAVIAVAMNEKENGLALSQRAVDLDPSSPAGWVALSYARQAAFDLEGALASLEQAVRVDPQNALAWARLAELQLSFRYLDRSLDAAQRAVELNPRLSRTQTVLGFAHLMKINTREAREAFNRAILLDQADPLPRLGLGLAMIRDGDLEEGRQSIEVAVALNPNNSLIRSYLGKAYFEEKREKQAAQQLNIAKELDPKDPTPWLYDGILKQTLNRPVEALESIEKSIDLNDNRAIYRSRLLLDEDLAVRSVNLARIYDDLGFQWLALKEGWNSLSLDPANFSVHRFLADSYFSLPRHEIARVSELLQAQLLQPLNLMPIQPQLGESNIPFPTSAGHRDPSYNEYTPLFVRNQFTLLTDGMGGEKGTFAEDVVHSGLIGRFSYSLGQFHSETDGLRPNNQQVNNIYDVFAQMSVSPMTSIQAEYRRTDSDLGNPLFLFDPSLFSLSFNERLDTETFRFGFRHSFQPNSDLVGSFMYRTDEFHNSDGPFSIDIDASGYGIEIQHLYRSKLINVISGAGQFNVDLDRVITFFGPPSPTSNNTLHNNFYVYSHWNYPEKIIWTLGFSADFMEGGSFDHDVSHFNPKLGLSWKIFPATTLRAAVFRTLKRTLLTNQTIEPTQIAGFNQFFDEPSDGTEAWRYGIGLDQRLTSHLSIGAEFSGRDLTVPTTDIRSGLPITEQGDSSESLARAYFYWTPHRQIALGPEYQYELVKFGPNIPRDSISRLETHRWILGTSFFHPLGFYANLRPTIIFQDGEFRNSQFEPLTFGDSTFFVMDAAIGYRLPKRLGLVEAQAQNLFDNSFRFQDTDARNPTITPDRFVVLRWTLSF